MPCVLLHGFTGTPAAWDDVLAHGRIADPIAIALPGHGGGPVGPSWSANLDAIAAAIAARGGAGAPVVGYSLGARVALGLVVRGVAPAAVLISVHPGLATRRDRVARKAADAVWRQILERDGIDVFAAGWEDQPVLAARHADPAAIARRAAARRSHDPHGLSASLREMGLGAMPGYRSMVAAGARLALVAGAEDAKFLAIARELAAEHALPLAVIADSGHDPTLDAPAALATVVADALGRLTATEQGATVVRT